MKDKYLPLLSIDVAIMCGVLSSINSSVSSAGCKRATVIKWLQEDENFKSVYLDSKKTRQSQKKIKDDSFRVYLYDKINAFIKNNKEYFEFLDDQILPNYQNLYAICFEDKRKKTKKTIEELEKPIRERMIKLLEKQFGNEELRKKGELKYYSNKQNKDFNNYISFIDRQKCIRNLKKLRLLHVKDQEGVEIIKQTIKLLSPKQTK
ncbi:MAG: hypothetical protein ACLFP2_00195 [Candidatus Woesearchaeota archaeon]